MAVPSPATPPLPGTARRPIVVVKIDGAEAPMPLRVKTLNVSHDAADTFEVEFSLQALARAAIARGDAKWGPSGWGGDNPPQIIEVLYGLLDANGNRSALNSIVIGPADSVEIGSPENILRLHGRDYSAALIDTQTFENFTNQTASQIATTIAGRHGLTPVVQATKTPVGAKDADSNATTRNTRRESEWDLLSTLARNEGFVVYVRGRNLYFQPDTAPTGTPYKLTYVQANVSGTLQAGNFVKLTRKRALTLASSVTVTVISHDPSSGKAVSAAAQKQGPQSGPGRPQTYTVDIPGLTAAQAQARANQLLLSYSLFERVIEVELPGDPLLSFEQPILLAGTNTGWDQTYFADRIEREMSLERGFTMHIRAKNHSTSQTTSEIPQGSN